MNTKAKKLHLNIKGKPARPFHGLVTKLQAHMLGLDQPHISYGKGEVKIEVVGDKTQLWKLIAYTKRSGLVSKLKEIDFHFRDLEVA